MSQQQEEFGVPTDFEVMDAPFEPRDLMPIQNAAREFGFRVDTLMYRHRHNNLPVYRRKIGEKTIVHVSRRDMEAQKPVNEGKSKGAHKAAQVRQKRPDVAERNKARAAVRQANEPSQKRKYTKRGHTLNAKRKAKETAEYEEASESQNETRIFERHVCYAFGRVQAWLDIYAGSIGLTPSVLTNRVGELLQLTESGSILGIGYKMSSVR